MVATPKSKNEPPPKVWKSKTPLPGLTPQNQYLCVTQQYIHSTFAPDINVIVTESTIKA